MALNIKNAEVERLATELAARTGESKTETIRKALVERSLRLAHGSREQQLGENFLRFLEEEVWPHIPPSVRGRPMTRDEEDEILGYGPEGV